MAHRSTALSRTITRITREKALTLQNEYRFLSDSRFEVPCLVIQKRCYNTAWFAFLYDIHVLVSVLCYMCRCLGEPVSEWLAWACSCHLGSSSFPLGLLLEVVTFWTSDAVLPTLQWLWMCVTLFVNPVGKAASKTEKCGCNRDLFALPVLTWVLFMKSVMRRMEAPYIQSRLHI